MSLVDKTSLNYFAASRPHCPGAAGKRRLMALSGLPVVLALSTAAHAADPVPAPAAEQPQALETVVVTARKVRENLQVTPVAITALSGAQLAARGIDSLTQLAVDVPSVSLNASYGGSGKSVLAFIRGVGQGDFLPAFEPGVGIYVDDIYTGTLFGSLADLTDIDSVEVLRGPQGTLFGKSNEGGALRINTPQAKGNNSGYVEAGYGSYNKETIRGAFDLPLTDNLAVRISGGTNKVDGYVDQIDYGCANPNNSQGIKSTRRAGDCKVGTLGGDSATVMHGTLRWTPVNGVESTLSAYFDDDKGEPTAEVLIAAANRADSAGRSYGSQFLTGSHYKTYASYTDTSTGISFPKVNNVFTWGVNHHLDWHTPYNDIEVRNILGFMKYNGEFTEDWGNAPVHVDDNYFKPEHHQVSEELQVLGKAFNNRLDWVLGGYYYDAHTELNDFIYISEGDFAFYGTDPVHDSDKSFFVHGVYHPLDKLDVEAGVRYTMEEKVYTFNRYLTSIFSTQAAGATVAGFENNPSAKATTNRPDYRVSVQYRWTPSLMTYVQFSTGFKGGGINPRPNNINEVTPFKSEDLKSFEVGVKSQWFENRLRANIDAYVSKYTNLQLSIPISEPSSSGGTVSGSAVANAGRVQIDGIEAEFQAAPIPNSLINVSADWLNYDIQDLGTAASISGAPQKGDLAPYVPEYKFNIGAQYKFDMDVKGAITPRLDYSWQSKTYSDADNTAATLQKAYGVLDAHLIFDSGDHKWQARFDVKNLANQFYFVNEFNQLSTAGMLVGQPSLPRTFAFTVRRSF